MAIDIDYQLDFYSGDPDPEHKNTKTAVQDFVRFFKKLQTVRPYYDGRDRLWRFSFPTKEIRGGWLETNLQEYNDTIYCYIGRKVEFNFNLKERALSKLQVDNNYAFKAFKLILKLCESQIKLIKADFVKYEARRFSQLPMHLKKGVIPRKLVWKLIPDLIRPEKGLSPQEQTSLFELFSQQWGLFQEAEHPKMTVNKYLGYCKVAYDAVMELKENRGRFDKNTTGREYYKTLSDGRYSHFLDIDPDSPEAFEDWYHNRGSSGDHPWEILRGGNTTHIDLGVSKSDKYYDPKENKTWIIYLAGGALTRMLETCKIAAALYKAGLPFKWYDWESTKRRILGDDHIGVMPEDESLHRGWQTFPEHLHVYDVLYLADFGKKKALAKKLVQWLPTESHVLAPIGVSVVDKVLHKHWIKKEIEYKKRDG